MRQVGCPRITTKPQFSREQELLSLCHVTVLVHLFMLQIALFFLLHSQLDHCLVQCFFTQRASILCLSFSNSVLAPIPIMYIVDSFFDMSVSSLFGYLSSAQVVIAAATPDGTNYEE